MVHDSGVSSRLRWSLGLSWGEPEFGFWHNYVMDLMRKPRNLNKPEKSLYIINKFLRKHGVPGSYLEHVGWSSRFRNGVFRLVIPGHGEKYFMFVPHESIRSTDPGMLSFVEPTIFWKC